jgi:hypothetical protein
MEMLRTFVRRRWLRPADPVAQFEPAGRSHRRRGTLWCGSIEALRRPRQFDAIFTLCPNVRRVAEAHYFFPVRDDPADERRLRALLPYILRLVHLHLARGEHVLIHCHMGLQRAPTVCYALLRACGCSRRRALALVRRARRGAFLFGPTFRNLVGN